MKIWRYEKWRCEHEDMKKWRYIWTWRYEDKDMKMKLIIWIYEDEDIETPHRQSSYTKIVTPLSCLKLSWFISPFKNILSQT